MQEKEMLTRDEKAELFDQICDLMSDRYYSDMGRERDLHGEVLTAEEDNTCQDLENKMQAMFFGRLMECQRNDAFMEQLAKLTIKRTLVDVQQWHHEKFYINKPQGEKENLEPSLFLYFKDEIDLLKSNMIKGHSLIRHLMLTYCLRHKLKHNKVVVKKLFLLFGGYFPTGDFYQTPDELYSALRKCWNRRDEESELIKKAVGENPSIEELTDFFKNNIKDGRNLAGDRKKFTTFPSFEKDFLPVFLPK